MVVRAPNDSRDSVLVGAPGRALINPIALRAVDGNGRPVVGATVVWSLVGRDARVEHADNVTAPDGRFEATWVLGTDASEQQRLIAKVQTGEHAGTATLTAVARPVEVAAVSFVSETTTVKLAVPALLQVQATDPFGNRFTPTAAKFLSLDTAYVVVDSSGHALAHRRGYTRVAVFAGSGADSAWVHSTQVVRSMIAQPDTLFFHAIGQVQRLGVQLLDDQGLTVADSLPHVEPTMPGVVEVQLGSPFVVRSISKGATAVAMRLGTLMQQTAAIVDQRAAAVRFTSTDVTLNALADTTRLQAQAFDSLGQPIVAEVVAYSSTDTSVVTVRSDGVVTAKRNGSAVVYARADSVRDSARVTVAQEVARVAVASQSLVLDALQAVEQVHATPVDRLGFSVTSAPTTFHSQDSTIATVTPTGQVRAVANGTTGIVAKSGIDTATIAVQVAQAPDTILAAVRFAKPIVTLAVGDTLSLSCEVRDRNGFPMTGVPAVATGAAGTVTGSGCGSLTVRRSGYDTLRVSLGGHTTAVAVVVAAAPVASSAVGDFISVDSFPSDGTLPWAPSARLNSQGELEVYFAVYTSQHDSTGYTRADMHRIVSTDGVHFTYAGRVLTHDSDICSPQGQGLENIVVLPRQEAPGWRMLYAAGSNLCWGWQVFSAVSTDGVTWTKEPGFRLSNGQTVAQFPPPWPVGEGMAAYQDASGVWRMLVGTEDHVDPPQDVWQIGAWHSADQLNWSYDGPVLTPSQMPPEGGGHVYSPTIREVAPGLWRMVFTADNRPTAGHRSKLWSAVSTDRIHWQVEGVLVGSSQSNLYYASLVSDRLIFIRQDDGGPLKFGVATVTMP